MPDYGPDKPCQRTACAEREPHLGGVHIDPRHEWYDGPGSTIQALPLAVRDSARKLIAEAPALMPEVVDMAREIHRLRDQVAAVSVDADRQVRAAMKRAEDCDEHGKAIHELGEQLHEADQRAERNDAARVALLSGWRPLEESLLALQRKARLGEALPDAINIVNTIAIHVARTMDAHKRAWSK